ncbi:MAG: hypothetical protein ACK4PR_11080, partial [Gammaproteobacteria bacterium]
IHDNTACVGNIIDYLRKNKNEINRQFGALIAALRNIADGENGILLRHDATEFKPLTPKDWDKLQLGLDNTRKGLLEKLVAQALAVCDPLTGVYLQGMIFNIKSAYKCTEEQLENYEKSYEAYIRDYIKINNKIEALKDKLTRLKTYLALSRDKKERTPLTEDNLMKVLQDAIEIAIINIHFSVEVAYTAQQLPDCMPSKLIAPMRRKELQNLLNSIIKSVANHPSAEYKLLTESFCDSLTELLNKPVTTENWEKLKKNISSLLIADAAYHKADPFVQGIVELATRLTDGQINGRAVDTLVDLIQQLAAPQPAFHGKTLAQCHDLELLKQTLVSLQNSNAIWTYFCIEAAKELGISDYEVLNSGQSILPCKSVGNSMLVKLANQAIAACEMQRKLNCVTTKQLTTKAIAQLKDDIACLLPQILGSNSGRSLVGRETMCSPVILQTLRATIGIPTEADEVEAETLLGKFTPDMPPSNMLVFVSLFKEVSTPGQQKKFDDCLSKAVDHVLEKLDEDFISLLDLLAHAEMFKETGNETQKNRYKGILHKAIALWKAQLLSECENRLTEVQKVKNSGDKDNFIRFRKLNYVKIAGVIELYNKLLSLINNSQLDTDERLVNHLTVAIVELINKTPNALFNLIQEDASSAHRPPLSDTVAESLVIAEFMSKNAEKINLPKEAFEPLLKFIKTL